ncbi:MAG: hypothetical protein IPL96_14425 [Holophagaceae bacterium]|nr:hypothetical protein [Holophagaceae bacterium]
MTRTPRSRPVRSWLACLSALSLGTPLAAWSPRVHEAQTRLALRMVPVRLLEVLKPHQAALLASARGLSNDQPPTVEDVEEQFLRIVALSELKTPPERMAKELGVLAHQVQLLSDPSVTQGVTSLREYFETYTDGRFRELVVSREPFWAAKAPLDPRPPLLRLAKVKFERHGSLAEHFDAARGRSIGHWDELSVPYAQMQLSFSTGVNATANMWTLLWRAVGDLWENPRARDAKETPPPPAAPAGPSGTQDSRPLGF